MQLKKIESNSLRKIQELLLDQLKYPTHKCKCGWFTNSKKDFVHCPNGCEGLIQRKKNILYK